MQRQAVLALVLTARQLTSGSKCVGLEIVRNMNRCSARDKSKHRQAAKAGKLL